MGPQCYSQKFVQQGCIMRFIPQRKPCEALLSPVFEVVAESNQDQWTGKGHILLLDQNAKGTLEAQGHSALW